MVKEVEKSPQVVHLQSATGGGFIFAIVFANQIRDRMTIYSEDLYNEEGKLEGKVEEMESRTFDVEFDHDGKNYKGWVTPSGGKGEDGIPKSFHVVLNEVFFGNLYKGDTEWETESQREHSLVQAAGKQIDNHLKNLGNPVI